MITRRLRLIIARRRLDRELADGLAANSSDIHQLRASQLMDPRTRRRLARSLRRAVAEAERVPRPGFGAAVPVLRREVSTCREALIGLSERLERPGPVNPRAVARTLVLLTDGLGPLYNRDSKRSLTDFVWWIADGFKPARAMPIDVSRYPEGSWT
jgi:hypothetical protein